MKVWIVGGYGMVGSALVSFLQGQDVQVIVSGKDEADISSYESLEKRAEGIRPSYIFNCAAMTNVDAAEANPSLAYSVNALGPYYLGILAEKIGAKLIHLSTDYVFSSSGPAAFKEDDEANPINAYGLSKLEGEIKLKAVMPRSCIVRTSWVYGGAGKNFISSIATMLREKEELKVAFDQKGKPTFCRDLAKALWELRDFSGVYHFSGGQALSRYEIAEKIYSFLREQGAPLACKRIVPVEAATFFTPAKRPTFSVLDTGKFERDVKRAPLLFTATLKELFHEVPLT